MSSLNALAYAILFIASPFVHDVLKAAAYVVPSPNAISAHSLPQPTSALASKVIYESPSIENIYKEYLVTSKPIVLRKYGPGMKKTKKTKKDSKIYFIPIPPMPYRFIPGVGLDYQPVKIKPIMKDVQTTTTAPNAKQKPIGNDDYSFNQMTQQNGMKTDKMPANNILDPTTTAESSKNSRIIRLNFDNYQFNGRPYRLQVAHAQQRHHLNSNNLKSKFYFNKNIIY